ncbi:MAG: glycosyltransferase [Chthoniobacterales bacterium]|nr:glycosyltransferase [Chthoniobacterales bacterium]
MVACYCATFLKPEMLHIYRQITALETFRPIVIAQKREESERFPFSDVTVIPKPATHFLRRVWFRQIRDVPWQVSQREVCALRAVLTKADARLLHIYFGHIAVHLLPLIRVWPKPVLVSFHGADVMVDLAKPAYLAATKKMLAAAELVLVRSESLGKALLEIGCDAAKLRLQRTGIPLDQFPFRERTWPANGAWRLLQTGRLIPKKGFATTLRAFAAFAQCYPNASLTIAGEGPLRSQLEALARDLGVTAQVNFPGFLAQDSLRELLYRSHLFLHPSETGEDGNQEGVPNGMLEAMASGLPVFATSHGGIPEAVIHVSTGFLVAERDAPSLGRELLTAVLNPARLSQIARAGSAAVTEKFEQRSQVRKLEEYYAEAIRHRGNSG